MAAKRNSNGRWQMLSAIAGSATIAVALTTGLLKLTFGSAVSDVDARVSRVEYELEARRPLIERYLKTETTAQETHNSVQEVRRGLDAVNAELKTVNAELAKHTALLEIAVARGRVPTSRR